MILAQSQCASRAQPWDKDFADGDPTSKAERYTSRTFKSLIGVETTQCQTVIEG
jgi:hypothetical protein